MKRTLISLLLVTSSMAQEQTPVKANEASIEAAMEKIFSSMSPAELPAALEQARKAGIAEQVLLEARFLHYVDIRDDAALAALAPEFIKLQDSFDPDTSEVFAIKEDWLAVAQYTQALAALAKDDKAGFKTHITEAFWLSPRQGQAFAPHINRLRMDAAMAAITFPKERSLQAQDGSGSTKLASLIDGKKGAVLHFWSPLSQEVQLNFPDFILTTQSCKDQDIPVISILIGHYPNIIEDAESMRKEDAEKALCTWLVDSNKNSLASMLRITDIPTMVIISTDGKILFNGHPSDDKFWNTMKKVAPEFKRPNNTEQKNTGE